VWTLRCSHSRTRANPSSTRSESVDCVRVGCFVQAAGGDLTKYMARFEAGLCCCRVITFVRTYQQKGPASDSVRIRVAHQLNRGQLYLNWLLLSFGAGVYAATGSGSSRARSSSMPLRPYIWRFSILRRLICPSTGPLLQGWHCHVALEKSDVGPEHLLYQSEIIAELLG
jgi:hypothetical protein